MAERIGLDSPSAVGGGDAPLHSQRFGDVILAKSAPYRTYTVLVTSTFPLLIKKNSHKWESFLISGGAYRTRTYGPL